jgi:hypothetical protein
MTNIAIDALGYVGFEFANKPKLKVKKSILLDLFKEI